MDRRNLIDERIRILLTSTDLTFKQIIEQLRSENMSASFNTIRRVNRNHRYRKPRYDAKLTPRQRKELIIKLKNTSRPNLSSLARHYGVCHGSIWYWWDKLSKIREKNNGTIPDNEPSLEIDSMVDQDYMSGESGSADHEDDHDEIEDLTVDPDSDPLDLEDEDQGSERNEDQHFAEDLGQLEMVGPVQAKSVKGDYIRLPIVMYAPVASPKAWDMTSPSSRRATSTSSINSLLSTSTGQSSSLSKRLRVN